MIRRPHFTILDKFAPQDRITTGAQTGENRRTFLEMAADHCSNLGALVGRKYDNETLHQDADKARQPTYSES